VRRADPQSPCSRDAVRLMRGGATPFQAAQAVGVKVQTAEKFWLRWIVLPENAALKARIAELEAELAARR
jgi:hypothetical protein